MCFNSYIKSHDLFGHTIAINLNKEGDKHQTCVGGCMSLFVKIVMLMYILLNVMNLVLYDADSIVTRFMKLDLDEAGKLDYNATNQLVFWVPRYNKNGMSGI